MAAVIEYIKADTLVIWVTRAFEAAGLRPEDARRSATMLVQTSLWGIDSHGVARVPHYLERLGRGSIVAHPMLNFKRTAAGTGHVEGGHGLGFIVCEFAMARAIELARQSGVGVVGVANSSHCGAIGLYTRQACDAGMIGVAFTHSDSFVVPHGGKRAFFGTNPISIAIPTTNPAEPLCVDMATSIAPWNRIMNARRENRPVALGLGVDANGEEATDPHRIVAVKPMAEHKGYALAFAIDMLCGPLNGMACGPHLTPMYAELDSHRKLGSLMMALDPVRFVGGTLLADAVLGAVRELKAQGEQVFSPGEPEYRTAQRRAREGIPMDPGLLNEFAAWADRLHLGPLKQLMCT